MPEDTNSVWLIISGKRKVDYFLYSPCFLPISVKLLKVTYPDNINNNTCTYVKIINKLEGDMNSMYMHNCKQIRIPVLCLWQQQYNLRDKGFGVSAIYNILSGSSFVGLAGTHRCISAVDFWYIHHIKQDYNKCCVKWQRYLYLSWSDDIPSFDCVGPDRL